MRRITAQDGGDIELLIRSAGTHDFCVGDAPDPRSQLAARRRGFDLSTLRARQLAPEDFACFDYILAMDERNLRDARAIAPREPRAHLQLLLDYAPACGRREVPDPYYGGLAGFEDVLDLVESGSRGLLEVLRGRRMPVSVRGSHLPMEWG